MEDHYDAYRQAGIIAKYLKGELSPLEEIRLRQWVSHNPRNAELFEQLQNDALLKADLDFFSAVDKKAAWKKIKLRTQNLAHPRKNLFLRSWKYAAAIVTVLSVILVYYRHGKPALKQQVAYHLTRYKQDVAPGKTGALFTSADGTQKYLAELPSVHVSTTGFYSFKTTALHTSAVATGEKNKLNIITTPLGREYRVILPDGSKVWLNSASTLKFPSVFADKQRRVYLTGEAYFEVAKNKYKPFKVFANKTVVQVLGTHFNVEAYPDETNLKATLLEGSINIKSGTQSKLIVPGQQAQIKPNAANINVLEANTEQATAWKNDRFTFYSEDIQSVMRQVARWYNVQVQYTQAVPGLHFSGSVSKNNNLSQILHMLELTGGVHFEITDRKIIVSR